MSLPQMRHARFGSHAPEPIRTKPKSTLRPALVVFVLVAAAWWGFASLTLPFAGPWCVWARPIGTAPEVVQKGSDDDLRTPPYGDVRRTPGGESEIGDFEARSRETPEGPWTAVLRWRRRPILVALRLEDVRTFVATSVRRTDEKGVEWTAFVPAVRPGALPRKAVEQHCIGTWTVTSKDGAVHVYDLDAQGDVDEWGSGAGWGVLDGTMVIDHPDPAAPGGAGIKVGVLADDHRTFEGVDAAGRTIHGELTER